MDNMGHVKQKLRIAVFHNLEACGAKRALWNLARELHRHGHVLDLYTFTTADEQFLPLAPFVTQTVNAPIAPLHLRLPATLPVLDQARNVWNRLRHLPRIAEAHQKMAQRMNQGRYDVAYIDCCMFTHIPDVLRYLRTPSIFFCHEPSRKIHERPINLPLIPSSNSNLPKQPRWKNIIAKADGLAYGLTEPFYKRAYHRNEEQNIRAATCVLTNSYYTRELIYQTYGVFANVNYLGVDTEFFKPLPNIAKENMVLSVGRFDVLKQHHVVLQSVGQIPKPLRPQVVIIGETKNPGYVDYLQRLARALEVALQIQVSATEQELVTWYNRAKAVIFVHIFEPFGFISLEAMACGTPIIAVREGGIREVIQHEETGIFVNRESQEIATAILKIFQDQSFSTHLSRTGRKYVCEHWTWCKSYERLLEHFSWVIAGV